ncbi:hypothetical protein E3Q22_03243 [Wallemia mellicola]|uniref:Uncharacterized protein n=1 Tax=Wallemia mellicola TaxID=1708541 RepID=A0A4T0NNE9_9BASI|nr:hypothetical protein E3Q23_03124 [Wallemia mellicola]TIB77097.1 hypothetical protein E3Q22_03243 [Wallemia mellicola]TIB97968.1 hypothetical protein E3Q17_03183 [Wallemia mellicola]TIC09918.1 hypothetical protein E3Q15_03297 [Wallemia mellicola]TIC10794.1 hypothetical protein E3Q14_02582 [Wallemia mellicola]
MIYCFSFFPGQRRANNHRLAELSLGRLAFFLVMTNQRSCGFNFWNGFLAIILPPVSVAITTDCQNNGVVHVLLNIVLWSCLILPGIIHAFWVLLKWDERLLQKQSPEVIYVQQAPTNQQSITPIQQAQSSPAHKAVQQHPPDAETSPSGHKNPQKQDQLPNYNDSQREAIV